MMLINRNIREFFGPSPKRFPVMKGFYCVNLMYMRAFAEAWSDAEIVQQLVGRLKVIKVA